MFFFLEEGGLFFSVKVFSFVLSWSFPTGVSNSIAPDKNTISINTDIGRNRWRLSTKQSSSVLVKGFFLFSPIYPPQAGCWLDLWFVAIRKNKSNKNRKAGQWIEEMDESRWRKISIGVVAGFKSSYFVVFVRTAGMNTSVRHTQTTFFNVIKSWRERRMVERWAGI